jgi:hypothetical protein
MKRFLVVLVLLVVAVLLMVPLTANAQAPTASGMILNIPERTIRDETGSSHLLVSSLLPGKWVGRECEVKATAANDTSVHLNNDFIISSGDSSVTLVNVERGPGAVTTTSELLVLDKDLSVTLFLGNNEGQNNRGVFSGGFTVALACNDTPEPTPTPTEPDEPNKPNEPNRPDEPVDIPDKTADTGSQLPFTGLDGEVLFVIFLAGVLLICAGNELRCYRSKDRA